MRFKDFRKSRTGAGSVNPYLALAAIGLLLAGAGCAALVASGAVAGAAAGVDYTYDNIAYKTFAFPYKSTFDAVMTALKKMDIPVVGTKDIKNGQEVVASTVDLRIEIELERITARTTKVSVNAKKGVIAKDKPTATEILVQTGKVLEGG